MVSIYRPPDLMTLWCDGEEQEGGGRRRGKEEGCLDKKKKRKAEKRRCSLRVDEAVVSFEN